MSHWESVLQIFVYVPNLVPESGTSVHHNCGRYYGFKGIVMCPNY